MDHEKQARSDATELKLKVLDDKLLRAQIPEEEKLRPLNEQIERLMEELSAERLSREVSNPPSPIQRRRSPTSGGMCFCFEEGKMVELLGGVGSCCGLGAEPRLLCPTNLFRSDR